MASIKSLRSGAASRLSKIKNLHASGDEGSCSPKSFGRKGYASGGNVIDSGNEEMGVKKPSSAKGAPPMKGKKAPSKIGKGAPPDKAGKGTPQINIVIATGGGAKPPMGGGLPPPDLGLPPGGPPPPGPKGPPPPPPAGGPPGPGGPPPMPMMRARGGRVNKPKPQGGQKPR